MRRVLVLSCLAATLAVGAFGQNPETPFPPRPTNQYGPNVVPEGTSMLIRLTDTLDSNRIDRGKHFQGKLAEDVMGPNGNVLIPAGHRVKGHVSDVSRGLHGRLLLSFDQIETNHGWIPLIATVTGVPGEHGVKSETGPEGEIERRPVDKTRTIEATAVGAAVGAAAGGAAGGGKGAGIGAAAGAGLGAAAGILTDRDLRLEKNQVLEIKLDRQMVVPRG